MKIRVKHIAFGVLAFNVGLVALTFGLSWQAQIQNPMMGSLVNVGGTDMHVIELSSDSSESSDDAVYDTLVLIHGASTSSLDFSTNLLPELSKRSRVVAIDRPGHGYSDRGPLPNMDNPSQQAKIILNTLAEMQIRKPVVIGHSWAGALVLAALLEEHDQVKPVAGILIAGVTHPYEREDSTPTKLALSRFIGPIFRWQYLTPIGRMAVEPTVKRFFSPDEVPENYIKETGLYLSLRPKQYLHNARDRSLLTDHLTDQSSLYPEIETPLLSIVASEDVVVPNSNHHAKLITAIPDLQAIVIDGAGHSPHHTRTNEVVSAIESFVDSLD